MERSRVDVSREARPEAERGWVAHGLIVTAFFFVAWFLAAFTPSYVVVRFIELGQFPPDGPAVPHISPFEILEAVGSRASLWVVFALSSLAGILLLRRTALVFSLPLSFVVAGYGIGFGLMLQTSFGHGGSPLEDTRMPIALGLGLMVWAMSGLRGLNRGAGEPAEIAHEGRSDRKSWSRPLFLLRRCAVVFIATWALVLVPHLWAVRALRDFNAPYDPSVPSAGFDEILLRALSAPTLWLGTLILGLSLLVILWDTDLRLSLPLLLVVWGGGVVLWIAQVALMPFLLPLFFFWPLVIFFAGTYVVSVLCRPHEGIEEPIVDPLSDPTTLF